MFEMDGERATYLGHVLTPSSVSLDSGGFFWIFTPNFSVAMDDCWDREKLNSLCLTTERKRGSTTTTTAATTITIDALFDGIGDITLTCT